MKFKVTYLVINGSAGTIISTNSLYDILTTYRGILTFKTEHEFDSNGVIEDSALILGTIQRGYKE